uniref:Si:dkeyp-72e1.6 n=1 Tax=Hucho hucho TaxID=62062 RepID=A0A4W5QJ15_9TELE
MEPTYRGLGRCSCAFWLAVSFDIFGLLVLLIGVFADIFFYDFLIYAGAIIIFLSLIWWVFWYTGNIEVPPEELEDDVGLLKKERGIAGAVRRLSSRLSNGVRNSLRDAQQQPKPPPILSSKYVRLSFLGLSATEKVLVVILTWHLYSTSLSTVVTNNVAH